jgi:hypothetical protein
LRTIYKLPRDVQRLADKNFQLLKNNPKHLSLQFKKIENYWSIRIGLAYRALAIKDEQDFIWVWIGSHEDYDRLIK